MSAENISKNGGPETKVNFNTAPEDELVAVPGVGPAMARRIIAERPFGGVADLQRVQGIGPNLLDRMTPYLTLETESADEQIYEVVTAEAPVVEEIVEAEVVELEDEEPAAVEDVEEMPAEEVILEIDLDEPVEEEAIEAVEEVEEAELEEVYADLEALGLEDEPAEEAEVEPVEAVDPVVEPAPQPVAPAPKTLTRGQAFGLAFGSSLLTFILALLVSLGVIASINNNQLRFATPADVNALNARVVTLVDQAETLQGDLEGLRGRVASLEPLGGRVDAVETTTTQLEAADTQLQTDMANTEAAVTELRGQTEVVAEQVDALAGQTDRFENFFAGLQTLMSEVFTAEAAP